jgi:hypothetical protein
MRNLLQPDSVSGELLKDPGWYNTIREKVIHYSFDQATSAHLTDSGFATRDPVSALLAFNQKRTLLPALSIKAVTPDSATVHFSAHDIEQPVQ